MSILALPQKYLAELLERLGIAKAIESKVTRPETDIVSELVAKGEVELGIVVITQILTTPGVDLVGPLPAEIQSYVVFSGGVSANSKVPDAAKQLLTLLIAEGYSCNQGARYGADAITERREKHSHNNRLQRIGS